MKKKTRKPVMVRGVREKIAAMKRFRQYPEFQVILDDWMQTYALIIKQGIDKPSVDQWNVLKGFCMAVDRIDHLASKDVVTDLKAADELQNAMEDR